MSIYLILALLALGQVNCKISDTKSTVPENNTIENGEPNYVIDSNIKSLLEEDPVFCKIIPKSKLNQIKPSNFEGGCLEGFRYFEKNCIYSSMFNDLPSESALHTKEINLAKTINQTQFDTTNACDPTNEYKGQIQYFEVEDRLQLAFLKNMSNEIDSMHLPKFQNQSSFIKIYNKEACKYECAVLERITGSTDIKTSNCNETMAGDKHFFCKYYLGNNQLSSVKPRSNDLPSSSNSFKNQNAFFAFFVLFLTFFISKFD